ncbi:MAG: phage tail family protein [Eubacteriales bacterium]|nr:phage tail family protein [Eubacteriales bacterium]
MSKITLKIVRDDNRTFTVDGSVFGLVAAEGLDEPGIEVFTQKSALGDGDLVTGQRVSSRTLAFTFKARHPTLNDVLRRAATSFFIASHTYAVHVSRFGAGRYADECRLQSLAVPAEAVGRPITVQCSFLMPEGYFLSVDSFGRNIAGIEGRCGYPYAALGEYGRLYGLYAYAETVCLQNDGDAEAYCKVVLTAHGTVVNPKFVTADGYVRVIATLNAGDVLVIDGRTKGVTLNGENASTKLDKGSTFSGIVFAPGMNTVGFTADIGANVLDVYVYYNKRFIGA